MKWLKRAGFGFADNYSKGRLSLERLQISYDQKIQYSTLQFHVPADVGNRFPGLMVRYKDCGPIYNCITDTAVDFRSIYTQRVEGNIGKLDSLDVTLLQLMLCSPSLLRRVGRR